jgi:hypothetical protein
MKKEELTKEERQGKKRGKRQRRKGIKLQSEADTQTREVNHRWQSAPYADSVQDFRRQDTQNGAELVTTRVLTDVPSWRSSQWRPPVNCTNSHCNPITLKAPLFLHRRTAGSPCRDGGQLAHASAPIRIPKEEIEKQGDKRKRAQNRKRRKRLM